MTESPEFIISKLEPKPGDLVVIKFLRSITGEVHKRVNQNIAPSLPAGVKLLVIDHNVDVSVLTAEEIQQRAVTDDHSRARSVSLDSA